MFYVDWGFKPVLAILLAVQGSLARGDEVKALAPRASTTPAPLVVAPSQYFEGPDGPWSSFTVQVGTPAQDVRVLISTAGFATWVILPEGCSAINQNLSECANLRGQLFNSNHSSTWVAEDEYNLGIESNFGLAGDGGKYGFDTIALGWQGSGGSVLKHQVVAGIETNDYFLGLFGLSPRGTNFTDFNDPQPSFLQTLVNESLVPSLSWSYTAGAQYRLDKVFASLVFGGYDLSRFTPNQVSFNISEDISRDLVVSVQSISFSSAATSNVSLLSSSIIAFIDSSLPEIWLPLDACKAFEKAFGLTYNETAELYLINDTLHSALVAQNANVTFKIQNAAGGAKSVDIVLPYASFDLTAQYPLVDHTSGYFPLKRASNDTQYTLGRTFLQEAYLIVDYERSNFSVLQCLFQAGSSERIVAIHSINSTSTSSSHSLSPGAIAGISIGGVVILLIIVAVPLTLYLRKRNRKRLAELDDTQRRADSLNKDASEKDASESGNAELDAAENIHVGHEMDGLGFKSNVELGSTEVAGHELHSNPKNTPVYEMMAEELAFPELDTPPAASNSQCE